MEPWLAELRRGHHRAAWDLFIERYRGLIVATIRRLIPDHDDVMDVFSSVCEALHKDECARLARFRDQDDGGASASTWLVVVVRNLTIDWVRRRDGRDRRTVPTTLAPLQQEIYSAVVLEGHSYVEAYEMIAARTGMAMTFTAFLREVRDTIRLVPQARRRHPTRPLEGPMPEDPPGVESLDPAITAESARRIGDALAGLTPDVRLAVELSVVDGMAADDVARAVGWPNAKAVYNRVHRALVALRTALERAGIGPDDLA
jgi:RNA polymerase sigma factor (sigma-70 family)